MAAHAAGAGHERAKLQGGIAWTERWLPTFGLLSVAGPFTFPEATLGTKLALTAMHLILTAAIVGAIVVRGRAPRSEP